MPRQVKRIKPLIYVFYEGESEQQYIDYLKSCFSDVAVIKRCSKRASTNLFADTKSRFEKDKKYRDVAEATDEIWFFFDVESKDRADEIWSERLKTINYLRKLRKKPNIRVRLLMTSGCVEYWFMLHFKDCAPPTQTDADKKKLVEKASASSTISAMVPSMRLLIFLFKGSFPFTAKAVRKGGFCLHREKGG